MSAPRKIPLSMTVNGALRDALVEPRTSLLTFLREPCALPGAKRGCEEGECGACVVLPEGQPVTPCLIFAVAAEGHTLPTTAPLPQPPPPAPIPQALLDPPALVSKGQPCQVVTPLWLNVPETYKGSCHLSDCRGG